MSNTNCSTQQQSEFIAHDRVRVHTVDCFNDRLGTVHHTADAGRSVYVMLDGDSDLPLWFPVEELEGTAERKAVGR